MQRWFQDNLDFVFFIYGLSFVVMGLAILLQPRKGSRFALAGILWLLAWFGLSHGVNEWLDMWAIIKGRNAALDFIRWLFLAASYIFIFEFGRRFFSVIREEQGLKAQKPAWWITPVMVFFILAVSVSSVDFWKNGSMWTRYLLGFPGSLLSGLGFILYYRLKRETLEPLGMRRYFHLSGLSFIAYGLLGGLVVPKGDFFTARLLNNESFLLATGLPVQVLRAVLAFAAAGTVAAILRVFDWENMNRLAAALEKAEIKKDELERLVGERTIELRALNENLEKEISGRKRAQEELARLAKTDRLTRAYNRAGFEEIIEREVRRTERYGSPLSLIIFDIDSFKGINDLYGHLAGDSVLQGLSDLVRRCIRDTDCLVRWGGDEFMVIAPETDVNGAAALVERTKGLVEGNWFKGVGKVTASFGFTEYEEGDDIESFIKRSDDALFQAKRRVRG